MTSVPKDFHERLRKRLVTTRLITVPPGSGHPGFIAWLGKPSSLLSIRLPGYAMTSVGSKLRVWAQNLGSSMSRIGHDRSHGVFERSGNEGGNEAICVDELEFMV